MRIGRIFVVLVLCTTAAVAQECPFEVWFDRPPRAMPAFGETTLSVQLSPPARTAGAAVTLSVDGQRLATLDAPPFELRVDLGHENAAHLFSAEVLLPDGSTCTATLETEAIRVDEELTVELQQLYVTVLSGQRRVLDLGPDDFRILDNAERQQLVTFERGGVPLTAAILIDSSASMKGQRLEAALLGAHAFVESMKELDQASISLFAQGVVAATPTAGDPEQLMGALEGISAAGNTAVTDTLFLALAQLDARQGRRVVLLLSDGADVHSALDMSDVLWKARRSQAMVYWIRLEDEGREDGGFTTAWRNADGNRAQIDVLSQIVKQSGGRIVGVRALDELESAFRGILAELREQYVLGYYPSTDRNDGSWHDIRVHARGHRVRTRKGYVDY